jgi:hypothetical protein
MLMTIRPANPAPFFGTLNTSRTRLRSPSLTSVRGRSSRERHPCRVTRWPTAAATSLLASGSLSAACGRGRSSSG